MKLAANAYAIGPSLYDFERDEWEKEVMRRDARDAAFEDHYELWRRFSYCDRNKEKTIEEIGEVMREAFDSLYCNEKDCASSSKLSFLGTARTIIRMRRMRCIITGQAHQEGDQKGMGERAGSGMKKGACVATNNAGAPLQPRTATNEVTNDANRNTTQLASPACRRSRPCRLERRAPSRRPARVRSLARQPRRPRLAGGGRTRRGNPPLPVWPARQDTGWYWEMPAWGSAP